MRKSNFALRLQPSFLDEARKLAEAEGVALNQLINVAVAEKVSALRTESYIAERAARADIPKALRILKRAGVGRGPMKGDELPQSSRKQWKPTSRDRSTCWRARCAWNKSDAVHKVNAVLRRIGSSIDYILDRAKAHKAKELTQKYGRREPATVKFIDELLAAAGESMGSLMIKALPKELDYIERIERLITLAENRRDASLREIDRPSGGPRPNGAQKPARTGGQPVSSD